MGEYKKLRRTLDALGVGQSEEDAREFTAWIETVKARGDWGPSPGGACQLLGCSRPMVDKLVKRGVLVRNEHRNRHGQIDYVCISEASIKRALQNKLETGMWTRSRPDADD